MLESDPGSITACNCTLFRRYGGLWAYDYVDGRIRLAGTMHSYMRAGKEASWRCLHPEADVRKRIAVNIRMAPPETVADLAIGHFDCLDTFEDLRSDGPLRARSIILTSPKPRKDVQ